MYTQQALEYPEVTSVQSLALFVRKRDPRYKSYLTRQSQLNTQSQLQAHSRTSGSGTSTPNPSGQKRTQQPIAPTYIEQEWQKIQDRKVDDDLEWAAVEGGSDPEEWECVVCAKSFRSEAAWDSHERSKKHMKEVERLKREMEEEEEELGLGKNDKDGEAKVTDSEQEEQEASDEVERSPISASPKEWPTTPNQTPPETALEEKPDPDHKVEAVSEVADEEAPTENEETEQLPRGKGKKAKRKGKLDPPELPTKTEKKSRTITELILPREGSPDVDGSIHDAAPENPHAADGGPEMELSKREKRRLREAKKAREGKDSNQVCLFPPCIVH